MKNISFLYNLRIKPAMLIATGYVIIVAVALNNYLVFTSLNFILGMLVLFFVFQARQQAVRSYRYGAWAIAFLVLSLLLPVKTLLYFTICFSLLFLVECFYGKLNALALFIVVLVSPVFQYAVNTFSFPIRLGLTKLAGSCFSAAGIDTVVNGNVIIHNGNEFSIDPGCMGLSMMESSLLLGAILVAYYGQRSNRTSSGILVLSYFGILGLLNVVANLFRIILLVHFAIMPGTVSHEITGIACLLFYVFIPAAWLAKMFVRKWGNPLSRSDDSISQPAGNRSFRAMMTAQLVLLGSVALLAVHVMRSDTYKKADLSVLKPGKDLFVSVFAPGIVKVQHKESLVYIKYLRGFYDTDHNPMLCWKGSGYQFEQVQQQTINGNEIYRALLVNGADKLYSAWWYTNGESITIDQFKWRWDMIRENKNYALVNITCTTPQQLNEEINKTITEKRLAIFFSNSFYH